MKPGNPRREGGKIRGGGDGREEGRMGGREGYDGNIILKRVHILWHGMGA